MACTVIAPHLEPSYVCNGWRSANVLVYAAPRGQPHTDKPVYEGLLHAFDFNNDVHHPLGVDRDNLSRITYRKNMPIPLRTYQKYKALLESRDMGVFAAVVHVTSSCVLDDQVNTFPYLAPTTCTKRNRPVSISHSPHENALVRRVARVAREFGVRPVKHHRAKAFTATLSFPGSTADRATSSGCRRSTLARAIPSSLDHSETKFSLS